MAFHIESRFVDIRTLVDFSEFNEADFYSPPPLNAPSNNDAASLPIQIQEKLDNSQALDQVTQIIVESEPKNNITVPVAIDESVLPISQAEESNSVETNLSVTSIEVVDKTTLYSKYISKKYDKDLAAEFIKILLNPFIVILAYRYEFLESSDNSFSVNLSHLKNLVDKKPLETIEEVGESSYQDKFQADLIRYNQKKELARKIYRA